MLQHELWIERLAERAGLHADTGYSLWRAYVGYVRHRLQTSLPAYVPPIGLCLVEQSQAYVAELPSAERYIVPPRLILRVQSIEAGSEASERELLSLCDALALQCELGEGLLLAWLRSIEPLVTEWLEQEQTVYWEGLGELTASQDSSGGLDAISWSLDPKLSLAVNKAFEVFRPVPLRNEGLLAQGLCVQSVASLEVLDAPQVITLPLRKAQEEPAVLAVSDVEEPIEEDGESMSVSATPIGAQEATPMLDEPTALQMPESSSEAEVPREPEGQGDMPEKKPRRSRWWLVILIIGLLAGGLYFSGVIDRSGGASAVPSMDEEQDDLSAVVSDSLQRDTIHAGSEPLMVDTPSVEELVPEPIVDPPAPDSVPQRSKEPKGKVPERPAVDQRSDQQEVVELSAGQSLRALAQRKYGDSVFWVYIYEENREHIADPDKVPIGTRLTLPAARKYGIDAQDTKARQRALILQRSYSSAP